MLAVAEALGPVREALKASPDDDLKTRLSRCERWLDPELAKTDLARLCRERYFQVESRGRPTGAERFGATVLDSGGQAVLSWSGEGAFEGTKGNVLASWTAQTNLDPLLTPLSAEFREVSENGEVVRWQVYFVAGRPRVRRIEGPTPREEGRAPRRDPDEERLFAPPTFDPCLSALIERASQCRLPMIALQSWQLGKEDAQRRRMIGVEFVAEETITRNGAPCPVRHYTVIGSAGEDFWISDADGLVRMTWHDWTVTPITRDAWLSSGWDEKSLVANTLKSRLDALRGADTIAAIQALLALQLSPESLPALKEAAASEGAGPARSRMESLCRWHDAEFGRTELANFGPARWFTRRRGGARDGWEWVGAKLDADGRWSLSAGMTARTVFGGDGTLTAAFRSPDLGLTSSFDAEIDMKAAGGGARISTEYRKSGMARIKTVRDGIEIPSSGESKPYSGGGQGPIVPSMLLPLFLERASLARLEAVQVTALNLIGYPELSGATFIFAGETRVTVAGKEVAARKYDLAGNAAAGTWWVTDEAGVVKYLRDGVESVASSEEEAKRVGDDPK
ncbi:MAG: hypothetical protein FD180_4643 [Planctomycetota bacterium]|nr:MAG: hypothetical protein FD180_4643 [Planctomycetota bacterium]